jgi:hypothetical protein
VLLPPQKFALMPCFKCSREDSKNGTNFVPIFKNVDSRIQKFVEILMWDNKQNINTTVKERDEAKIL